MFQLIQNISLIKYFCFESLQDFVEGFQDQSKKMSENL